VAEKSCPSFDSLEDRCTSKLARNVKPAWTVWVTKAGSSDVAAAGFGLAAVGGCPAEQSDVAAATIVARTAAIATCARARLLGMFGCLLGSVGADAARPLVTRRHVLGTR
jgi:hypothetical protein